MIKALVVDDHSIIRNSFKLIIEQDKDIKVVGFASNGLEALEACELMSPDIVLMDIRMPVCDGVEGTRLIKEKFSSIKILVISTFDDDEYVNEAIKNGADSYILKDVKDEELAGIIKSTVSGYKVVSHNVFEKIKSNAAAKTEISFEKAETHKSGLTKRQTEIIKLIIDGKSNKEIALELNITEGTIRNMISTLLLKYNLQDRTQLAVFGIKNNIL
ncbi:MAG TPA: response regulator transcription factor [Clostridia bacterium]